jgi:hypothetical protein
MNIREGLLVGVSQKKGGTNKPLNPYESLAEFSQLLVGILPPGTGRKADIKIFIDFSVLVSSD